MSNMRYYIYTAIVVVLIIAAGVVYTRGGFQNSRTVTSSGDSFVIDKSRGAMERTIQTEQSEQTAQAAISAEPESTEPTLIQVHITGAVKTPGVYELTSNSRVNDALEAAGGGTEDADLELINLAAYVKDAQKIYIPRIGEEPQPGNSNYDRGESGGGLININTASQEELTALPGIGPVTAEAIVRYRNENGAFLSPEDLKNVTRIGEKTYSALKDLITVNN